MSQACEVEILLSSPSSPTIPPLVRAELGFRLDLARLRSLPHMADIFGSHADLHGWLAGSLAC